MKFSIFTLLLDQGPFYTFHSFFSTDLFCLNVTLWFPEGIQNVAFFLNYFAEQFIKLPGEAKNFSRSTTINKMSNIF